MADDIQALLDQGTPLSDDELQKLLNQGSAVEQNPIRRNMGMIESTGRALAKGGTKNMSPRIGAAAQANGLDKDQVYRHVMNMMGPGGHNTAWDRMYGVDHTGGYDPAKYQQALMSVHKGMTSDQAAQADSSSNSNFSKDYNLALADNNRQEKRAEASHPLPYKAAKMAGDVTTSSLLPGGYLSVGAQGALSGAADSDDMSNLGETATKAGVGFAGGIAGKYVGDRVANKFGGLASKMAKKSGDKYAEVQEDIARGVNSDFGTHNQKYSPQSAELKRALEDELRPQMNQAALGRISPEGQSIAKQLADKGKDTLANSGGQLPKAGPFDFADSIERNTQKYGNTSIMDRVKSSVGDSLKTGGWKAAETAMVGPVASAMGVAPKASAYFTPAYAALKYVAKPAAGGVIDALKEPAVQANLLRHGAEEASQIASRGGSAGGALGADFATQLYDKAKGNPEFMPFVEKVMSSGKPEVNHFIMYRNDPKYREMYDGPREKM